jgi:hypothetical protein
VNNKRLIAAIKIGSAMTAMALVLLSGPSGSGTPPLPASDEIEPASVMRLITTQQFQNTLESLFGIDVTTAADFPALTRVNGLRALGATTALVPSRLLDMYDGAARSVAAQVVDKDHRDVYIHCRPRDVKASDDACARSFLGKVGRLLFRRALTPTELNAYAGVARDYADKTKNFYTGVQFALSGLLVAPDFVYLIERSEPDPTRPGELRLDGVSKATRLSLLLWNAPPDEALLDAAEKGELHTAKGLSKQVERMLASPNLEKGVRGFFADMLLMETFDNLAKDPVIYPAFTQQVAVEAREQIFKILVDHLVVRNGDYRDLFTTRRIFLTKSLNTIYGIVAPTTGTLDWVAYELPESDSRAGILTVPGFLSSYSHPGRSSATKRGKAVREIFMCQRVPDPPANVDFSAVEDADSKLHTARDLLNAHSTNPVCAGCHRITDPIGLTLENFDGAGQYRADQEGATIDTNGVLDGRKFTDAKGLGLAIRELPAFTSCLVKRVYEYSLGRRTKPNDRATLAVLEERFAAENYGFPALLRTVATSDSFFQVYKD